ncbi:MAG: protein jag [Spirochaetaceae bacterium]|jgi:spoIIIJ-associated protein|nr:protein jag [Spirochaetaceae bacterium]
MKYEFEGKTEKEAIEKAMQELGLDRDSFDVEILEAQRGGFFKKGYVRICLHTSDTGNKSGDIDYNSPRKPRVRREPESEEPAEVEFESATIEFITTLLKKMGCDCTVSVERREKKKTTFVVETNNSAIVIGKKGKNLDAIQLIANLHSIKLNRSDPKIILDCENYRLHHEESLIRLAYSVAAKVRNTKQSMLLEPMNPYDRKLIHATIGESGDVETNSEGEGLFKQIRVSYRGKR